MITPTVSLLPANGAPELLPIVDAAVADAYRRGGAHLVCRPGCTQCCVGVFAIAQQDADRLRAGLAEAPPDRAARIRARVAASLARLDPWFPGDLQTGVVGDDPESRELFEEFANDEVCPVLDPAAGTCDLYAHRPVLCRTFGPPVADEDGNLGTCELCFTRATPAEVAAAAIAPELADVEEASNAAWDRAHSVHGETLVAYALRAIDAVPSAAALAGCDGPGLR